MPAPAHLNNHTARFLGQAVNATSKVVDENGEPLVVYHGTSTDFDAFSKAHVEAKFGADGIKAVVSHNNPDKRLSASALCSSQKMG